MWKKVEDCEFIKIASPIVLEQSCWQQNFEILTGWNKADNFGNFIQIASAPKGFEQSEQNLAHFHNP